MIKSIFIFHACNLCLVSTILFLQMSLYGSASEKGVFERVDAESLRGELEKISFTLEQNYDKIKTWTGKISFTEKFFYYDDAAVKTLDSAGIKYSETPDEIVQVVEGIRTFWVEMSTDRLLCHDYSAEPFRYLDTKHDMIYPWTQPLDRVRIYLPDKIIECRRRNVHKNDGSASSTTTSWQRSRKKTFFISPDDPRRAFCIGGLSAWESLSFYSEIIFSDEYGDVEIGKQKTETGSLCRIIMTLPGSPSEVYTIIFDESKGFGPTFIERGYLKQDKKDYTVKIDYVKIEGVFVPGSFYELYYDKNGRLQLETTWVLDEMRVNIPLSEDVFSIQSWEK